MTALSPEQQRNTLRQLAEMQAVAERFERGVEDYQSATVEFNQFSQEMKNFLLNHTTNTMVLERLQKIDEVKYKAPKWHVLYFVFLPGILVHLARQYAAKASCKEKVREIAAVYSSIHFLMKAEWS